MELDKKLIQQIGEYLIGHKKTIAVAESVTSGNIQAGLSLAKDASRFFQGGITAYNLGQKTRHLGVEPIHAEDCNCVSGIVSEQMARNVIKMFLSDYSIGITGFASTVPEDGINELYAHICIVSKDSVLAVEKISSNLSDPYDVQIFYANTALKELFKCLIV
ncbi:MAG TPA: CinA family protein [Ferruginibacter sp.]|nr:CinA family protein [Ferruginibacter sp.]